MGVGALHPLLIKCHIKKTSIIKRIKRGKIRPEQIAAEAEELKKEFTGNTAFVEMMESFRSTFGMEDPDLAREAGQEGTARRNIVKERLRKKLEAKKAGKK